ncbi:MAG: PcfK-like family protein [Oscillospiraceae bacterium]|nr:PcfK-like family protein [Oscillospiraceae bacterium]
MAYTDTAIEKLEKESAQVKGNRMAMAMLDDVRRVLKDFCRQDEEFAQAICRSDKTLSDCMSYVADGVVRNSISDITAYKRAVEFYFPGADISFSMTIDLIGNAGGAAPSASAEAPKKSAMSMSFDELFD